MDVADDPTTVLIVDDQMPFRMAAKSVVGVTPGFEVVGEAKSGEEALEQVAALHPQLVLMDINMDGISGIEATRRITADHPEVRVILLSTYDEDDLPADARSSGALGYVHKEQFGPDVLVRLWPGEDIDADAG
jgi:two-component system invasion response regulator UvrY